MDAVAQALPHVLSPALPHPDRGDPRGVAALEAANNGTTGGAMVPMLTLGIPEDVVTAVMLSALVRIGVQPGPLLFSQHFEVINALFAGFLLAPFIMFGLGMAGMRLWPKILQVPTTILFPLALAFHALSVLSVAYSLVRSWRRSRAGAAAG